MDNMSEKIPRRGFLRLGLTAAAGAAVFGGCGPESVDTGANTENDSVIPVPDIFPETPEQEPNLLRDSGFFNPENVVLYENLDYLEKLSDDQKQRVLDFLKTNFGKYVAEKFFPVLNGIEDKNEISLDSTVSNGLRLGDIKLKNLKFDKFFVDNLEEIKIQVRRVLEESSIPKEDLEKIADMILFQIIVESHGDPLAGKEKIKKNKKKPAGLLQLSFVAWTEIFCEENDCQKIKLKDLRLTWKENLRVGVKYLLKMYKKFRRMDLALAAYAGGQGNLEEKIENMEPEVNGADIGLIALILNELKQQKTGEISGSLLYPLHVDFVGMLWRIAESNERKASG